MFRIATPFRRDQGDVSFRRADSVKQACAGDRRTTTALRAAHRPSAAARVIAKSCATSSIRSPTFETCGDQRRHPRAVHHRPIDARAGDEVLLRIRVAGRGRQHPRGLKAVPVGYRLHEAHGCAPRILDEMDRRSPRGRDPVSELAKQPDRRVLPRAYLERLAGVAIRPQPWVEFSTSVRGRGLRRASMSASPRCPGMYQRTIRSTSSAVDAMTGLRIGYVRASRRGDPTATKGPIYHRQQCRVGGPYGGIGAIEGRRNAIETFRVELKGEAGRDLLSGVKEPQRGLVRGPAAGRRFICFNADRSVRGRKRKPIDGVG